MKRTIRKAGVAHLRTVDPVMCAWIERAGPCLLTRRQDRFGALVRAILAQQISAHVANVVRKRIIALCAPNPISPTALLRIGEQGLRSAGCSRQKIADRWRPYASVGSWYCWRWHYVEGAYKPKQ